MNLYTTTEECGTRLELNKKMMELQKVEMDKPENKLRTRIIFSKLQELKRYGKIDTAPPTENGAFLVKTKGRKYYIYTNFVVEVRGNDNTFRLLYIITEGKDTIKLARQKSEHIGITQFPIVNIVLNSLNLQGKAV